MAIGIPPDGCGLDEEPFQVGDMLIDMIADTQQADNITMVRMEEEQLELEGADKDSDAGSVPWLRWWMGTRRYSWNVAVK